MPQIDLHKQHTWHFNVVARHEVTRRIYRTQRAVKASNYDEAIRVLRNTFNKRYFIVDIELTRISGKE